MEYEEVTSIEQLRELYDSPISIAIEKQKSQLDQYSKKFLALSSFSIISTANNDGLLDCSPRGDQPGFIQVLDNNTIAKPDRPGNNRLDSLSNIIENPNIGIITLIPGFNECLRINGTAKIVTNTELLNRFKHQSKCPISVIVVSIKEIYFHCAKAITRANLWHPESHIPRSSMPSFGRILMAQIDPNKTEKEIVEVEDIIQHRLKNTLY